MSEWFGKLGDKLKIRITIKGIADTILRSLKYVLLFITVHFTLQSNELFCKKFDPYYAVASGFDADVVVLYALITIALVVVGSVFVRLFWCKYLCPLGAVSNIFKFTGFFVLVIVAYLLLLKFGAGIRYVWPLAVACVGGYIIEITGLFGKVFPLVKITRNEETCTRCQLCSLKCPQAIDVTNLKVVRNADCNLCSECILVCPEKNTVQINKKKSLRWLPPVATVLLVFTGLMLGQFWEVPTIDEKWYGDEVMAKAKIFDQSGLKNIKCYGSSMAFAAKMKEVDGVLGVATFVNNHRVKVYYDPEILNDAEIQNLLFTPSIRILRSLGKEVQRVQEVQVWLENFFDLDDFNNLSRLLQEKTGAVYLSSEYDCPVRVKIYFPENEIMDDAGLKAILESKNLTCKENEKNYTVKLGYKVAKGPINKTIGRNEYITNVFEPQRQQFNYYERYGAEVIGVYYIPLGENKVNRNKLIYLISHLSNDNGIIGFRTFLNDSLKEIIAISYVDTMTNTNAINERLNSDTLRFTYRSGEKRTVANMFKFSVEAGMNEQ